jgi:hypothetical protein
MKPMHMAIIAAVLAILCAFAVLVILRMSSKRAWGFKDVVRNPSYWGEVAKAQKDADEAGRTVERWTDAQIASAVRAFVLKSTSSRDAWGDARVLRGLGTRAHAAVLSILREPGLYSTLVQPTGEDILPEAPFNRACDLLGDAPPREAVEWLAPFLSDSSEEIRKDAALAIGKAGTESITPHIRKALSDSDEYVRSYALMGMESALSRSDLHPRVSTDLYDDVKNLLPAGKNTDKAVSILYRLNPERSKAYFLSDEVLSTECPFLHEVLETLANERVPVPRARLLAIVASLETGKLEYPQTYALGEAFRLLGQQQRAEDRERLESGARHPEERVAQGAAQGLLASHGLEGFETRMREIEDQHGHDALSKQQRLYCAVLMCDGEINNGGLAQYFVNSSGDNWQESLAGYEAMGFRERLSVLREAVALFGDGGPSPERDTRQVQLSKLYRRDEKTFDDLDSRYYKSSEVVEVLASRYIIANAEAFR